MKTGRTFLLGVFAAAILSFGLSASANAQGGYNDPYYRGNDRRQNRRYDQYNGRRVHDAVRRIESRSEELEDRIDSALDRNRRLDGTDREDRIIEIADQFQEAANRLEDRIGNGRYQNNNGVDDARRLVQLGVRLDQIISRGRLNDGRLQSVWAQIRNDLRIVADAYNIRSNTGYNNDDDYNRRNRGYGRNRPY